MVGEEVQKLSIIESIPELLAIDSSGCMEKIFPKMQQTLPNGSTEYHMLASQTVKAVVQKKLISVEAFVDTFLQTILTSIDNRDPVVANAWIEALLEVMDMLPVQVIQKEIVPIALGRSQLTKQVSVRLSSCLLLGNIAKRYDGQLLKKDLLPTIMSLCQDVNFEVRACMCMQLGSVAEQLGDKITTSSLFPCIIELASDEVSKVKESAFLTIVGILHIFNTEELKFMFKPMLRHMISAAIQNDEPLLVTITSQFGKLCLEIERAISPQEKDEFVKWFYHLSQLGVQMKKGKSKYIDDPPSKGHQSSLIADKYIQCRQNCAFNLPAMAKFCKNEPELRMSILHTVLTELTLDPCFIIRRTIAAGFHEVANIFGKDCTTFKNEFINLLRDDAEDVLEGFIPNISVTMGQFVKYGLFNPELQTSEGATVDLTRALLKCENVISLTHNWRLHSMLFEQFECLHMVLTSDVLYNSFVTLLFKRIQNCRAVPIRLAIVKTLLVFLRYLTKSQHKVGIRNKIINDMCCSPNFYDRMLYVRSCDLILDIFSTNYFKEFFFVKTVALMEDPVPNIRWATCNLMPKLKAMIKLPAENKMMTMIEGALGKLGRENDREVVRKFNEIQQSLEMPDEFSKLFPNDHKKYEEEKMLAATSETREQAESSEDRRTNFSGNDHRWAKPGGNPATRRPAPSPSASSIPSTSPSSSSSQRNSIPNRNSVTRPQPNSLHLSLSDREFLVDAGVSLPSTRQGFQGTKVFREPSYSQQQQQQQQNGYRNYDAESRVSPKRSQGQTARREGIPIRWSQTNPPFQARNTTLAVKSGSNNSLNSQKRHSLEVTDLNRNDRNATNNNNNNNNNNDNNNAQPEKVIGGRQAGSGTGKRQSHLPRPLSCINFPVKSLEGIKPRPVSRLPVSRPPDPPRFQRRT